MKKKVVLVYGLKELEGAVCQLIEACHVTPRVVAPEELDETIGYLCGLPGAAAGHGTKEGPAVNQAILIFSQLTRKELDNILDGLRQAGLGGDALKAMVTETNARWTLRALSKELQEEKRTMTALIDLRNYRDSLPAPTVLNMRLMMAMLQVDNLLSGTQEVTVHQILQARKNLQEAAEQA